MSETFSRYAVAQDIEARIRANRLMPLPVTWADEILFPAYDGLSIRNVSQSIAQLFGAPHTTPLDPLVWGDDVREGAIDRVVLILTDGLGYLLLKRLIDSDSAVRDGVASLTDGRGIVPITSVSPSTTACALPTLWTAEPPAVHGMLGTVLYLREFGTLGDLLEFAPMLGKNPSGTFEAWGLNPETFIPVPSLAQNLASVGALTHSLLQYSLIGSGLSRQLHRGIAHHHPHAGIGDSWLRLTDVLMMTRGQKCCVSMYLPNIDGLSHLYGADSRYVLHEIQGQISALNAVLNTEGVGDGRTLVIVTADHGHHNAPNIADLSPIRESMRGTFGGDERFGYLYLREGHKGRVIDTLNRDFADVLTWFEPQAALDAGLFGTGTPHPDFFQRVGDLIVVPRVGTRLAIIGENVGKAVSIHSGMSDSEMLVPLLYKRI